MARKKFIKELTGWIDYQLDAEKGQDFHSALPTVEVNGVSQLISVAALPLLDDDALEDAWVDVRLLFTL